MQDMNMTHEELQDAKYEFWLLTGGAEKNTEKHKQLAEQSIEELKAQGWEVLSKKLIKEFMQDTLVTEIVARKENEVVLLKWHIFNKGWMKRSNSGAWIIF